MIAKPIPVENLFCKELKIQENKDAFKEIKINSQTYRRYSPLALDILKKELPNLDIEEVWQKNRPQYRASKRK